MLSLISEITVTSLAEEASARASATAEIARRCASTPGWPTGCPRTRGMDRPR